MDDDAWRQAEGISEFTQRETQEGAPATERTTIRMVYDDHSLYIGLWCYEDHPERIVANQLNRDFDYETDDNVEIILDTYHDHRNGFLFVTNPNGARYDALVTDEGEGVNADWNGVWDVHATVNDSGWFAEIEIPFSTLRFTEDSVQVRGINFERNIRYKREQDLWQGFLRNYELERLSQAGTLEGLKNIHRGKLLEVKPYALAGVEGLPKKGIPFRRDQNTRTKLGLDIKYPVTSTLTLDATANTDFAQVEVDREKINLTRFPLFFPEKREFFLEGAGVFNSNFGDHPLPFYSRRIGLADNRQIPIIAGIRTVGKVGDFNVGALNMQTAAEDSITSLQTGQKYNVPTANFSVLRVKRDILKQSYVGILVENKQEPNHYNRLFGADANFSFPDAIGKNTVVIGGAGTKTATSGVHGQDWAYRFFVDYPNDFIDHFIGIRSVEKNFNPEMGFVDRHGKELDWALNISPRPNWPGIQKLNFKPVDVAYYWDVKNKSETYVYEGRPIGFTTLSGETFEFNIQRNFDRLDSNFNIFGNVVIPPGKYYYNHYELQLQTNANRRFSGFLEYNWGDYYTGSRKIYYVSLVSKINRHLSFSGDYTRNVVRLQTGNFTTHEIGGRVSYAFSTLVTTAMFAQWNNEEKMINLNWRFNWIPKIGSDVYLVYDQLMDTHGRIRWAQSTLTAKVAYRFTFL